MDGWRNIAMALSDWTEFIEVSRRGFHVALGQLGLTITDLMASIKRAISPEMNDIPPMNTPAITSFGLGNCRPTRNDPQPQGTDTPRGTLCRVA